MSENTVIVSETTEAVVELVLPDYLQHLLDQIAVREGFAAGYTIETESGSNIGDGFQALMLRSTICGRRNNVNDQRLLLICKVPPASEFRRSMSASSFRQEVFAYETLLPKLIELQKSKNIGVAEGFYSFPKCYGTFSDETTNSFAIVLEDLCNRGCRMWNKMDTMDFAHIKLILTELGKYHALSFALRDQQPEVLSEYSERKSGIMQALADTPPVNQFYVNAFNKAIGVLSHESDVELKTKVTKLRDNFREVMSRVASGKLAEPFAVFNHGDCWNNNVMFEYDNEKSRKAKSVCIIDWQLGQYCSPATDLAYFLYSSTERVVRDEHFDEMLKVYHSSLTQLLTLMGSDAEKLFAYDTFLDQMKNFAIYAMVMAPMLVQIVTVDPNDLPDFDKIDLESMKDFEFMGKTNASNYEVRMRDVLCDFDSRGFFDSKYFDY